VSRLQLSGLFAHFGHQLLNLVYLNFGSLSLTGLSLDSHLKLSFLLLIFLLFASKLSQLLFAALDPFDDFSDLLL
jgi:hypothetical protein